MATKLNSVLLVAFILVVTATIGSSTLFTPIAQARITGTGLTCSNPSPFRGRPILSGATVTVTCNGATATTTTDSAGSFTTTLIFPSPVTVLLVLRNCRPIVTVPANCTIIRFGQRVTTLESRLRFRYIDTTVPGTLGQFEAPLFTAI